MASAFLAVALLAGVGAPASATPLIALREADNCAGCHKPGRSQRPVLERRCTLDCQGCHVDPAGAGPRNQWGAYYQYDQLTAVRFFVPRDPLEDKSRYDLHYDGRSIQRTAGGKSRTFPMNSELSARVRPFITHLHLIAQAQVLGRVEDSLLRPETGDPRRLLPRYTVMIDQLPMNLYVRAYRGAPMYGLRRSNHTLWIRERTGLDQYAQTEAVEFGGTPNVPFMRGSLMRGDPAAAPEDRQAGSSFHGGFRGVTMGWHLNASSWDTRSEKANVRMRAVGGGLKPWKFVIMGERNWREVTDLKPPADTSAWQRPESGLHPSSMIDEWTVAFAGVRGLMFGGVLEELHDPLQDRLRRSLFLDLHPIPFLAFEVWRRFEQGDRKAADTLGIMHLYADF